MIKTKLRREVILIYVVLSLFAAKTDIFASIDGIDEPIKGTSSDCYIYKQYAVSLKSSGRIGDLITVRKQSNQNDLNCYAVSKEIIMKIDGTDSTETFEGLYKHFLFTDSGTSDGDHGISVYDLNKKKTVYYANYSGDAPKIVKGVLIFSKNIESEDGVKCDVSGWEGPVGYSQQVQVELESLREEAIGKVSCRPVE